MTTIFETFNRLVQEDLHVEARRKDVERALDGGYLSVRMFNGGTWALRRNGRTQLWKTRPRDFRIPVKYGLRGYGSVTEASQLSTEGDKLIVEAM